MTLLLLPRLANMGQATVAQFPVSDVYREVQAHPAMPSSVKQMAQDFLTDFYSCLAVAHRGPLAQVTDASKESV